MMILKNSTRRDGIRFLRVRVGIAALSICAGVACAYGVLVRGDDLTTLLRAFSDALHGFEGGHPNDEARVLFYEHWLSVILDECEQLPPESVPESARLTCLSLANGARNYRLAESIAVDGAVHASNWQQRLTYWDQRVGLREAIAAQTGDPEDLASVGATAGEAIVTIRPTLADSLYARDSVSLLSVQRIFQVAARAAAAEGNSAEAAALMEESAAFLRGVPAATLEEIGFSWWADQCLQNASRYRLEMDDVPGAIRLLRQIDGVQVRRASASEHALICAGDAVPLGSFQEDFARAWLDQGDPWGASEIRMAYALAFSLSNAPIPRDNARLEEAVGLIETLLALEDALAEADAAASAPLLASGQPDDNWVLEPIRSNALVTLASAYSALGMRDERAVIAGMVVVDYPNHPAVSLMEAMLD